MAVVAALVIVTGAPLLLGLVHSTTDDHDAMHDAADSLVDTQQLSIAATARAAAARTFLRTGDAALLADRDAAAGQLDAVLSRLTARGRELGELDAIRGLGLRAGHAIDVALAAGDKVATWEREVAPAQLALRDAIEARVRGERAYFEQVRADEQAASRRVRELAVALVAIALLGLALAASILVRTGRMLFVRQRAEQEHALRQLLDQIPVGLVVAHNDGAPAYANAQARALLEGEGVSLDALFAGARERMFELGTDNVYPPARLPLRRALAGEHLESNDVELRRRDGETIPLHMRGAPVCDRDGKQLCAVTAFQDVRELLKMGGRDALTGLVNRAAIDQRFTRERLLAERGGRPVAVAVLDLDRFKAVNDRHGHATGDLVLREAARTVGACMRRTDIVARWGGEEFVIVMPDTDARGAGRAMEKALDAVRALGVAAPGGAPLRVTFSAGVVESRAGESLELAVSRADQLLYQAKATGRDRVLAERTRSDTGKLARASSAHARA
ncbi:MAG TPA: sensor domain-containing diguanylate cyclase [Kofleriaceae bacterium]|nr:sensor domain-containing diguanylate cyclase [Kofleriaceae bacterium]